MITDARVFQDEFVPNDVVHRDAEINYLSSTLRPITDRDTIEPVCLFGPSGTGKTFLARYTVEQLREEVIDLNTLYMNCWEDHSRFKSLYRILDGVGRTLNFLPKKVVQCLESFCRTGPDPNGDYVTVGCFKNVKHWVGTPHRRL